MGIVRTDAGLGKLVEGDHWTPVAQNLGFTEGPVWHPDGSLLFSDIPNDRVHRLRGGALDVYREPSGNANGLTLDLDTNLLACEHGTRRVSRERGGEIETIASHYDGKRLNSPNDIVVRSDGRIFFTDPPYGITEEQRELPYNGVFTLAPDGELSLLVSDFDRPNGLALSPDERTLYIADTARLHVRALDVAVDGALSNGRVFADMAEGGRPDGMKVDVEGRVYVAAGALQVFASDGKPLGVLDCPESPANCAWGEDGSTLYITARTGVYRLRFNIRGIAAHLR
ncbi:MAG: SMP-30/gluconolactonase/LRE family protein [Dehalococcoidia bacterium]